MSTMKADDRMSLLPSGNLYIIGVTVHDEGAYTCSATNVVTRTTRHSKVTYLLSVATGVFGFGVAGSYKYKTLSGMMCL